MASPVKPKSWADTNAPVDTDSRNQRPGEARSDESQTAETHATDRPLTDRPRGEVQYGIADADKEARSGTTEEPVRNTPPAGPWNDVA